MKAFATTLLLGAAVFAQEQQVLKTPETVSKFDAKAPYDPKKWAAEAAAVQGAFEDLKAETQQLWEDAVAALENTVGPTLLSQPKPSTRRHDDEFDYHVSGADIQSVWVNNADGEKERAISGKLENYNMRVKKVDPAALGVDKVKQYSGYLDDEEEDKHLFYWFFESRNDPKNDPVVLWLNGGPGCSSLTGLFMELGPSFVNKKVGLDFNPFAWNANASVIFLDQPVNVGYSYSGGQVSNTVAAGKDVYALMTLFFKQFPEYSKQPFHIAGESYAGHYIPVFASEILSHKNRNINLQSILIGNGLTDGLTQYSYYKPMACGEGGYPAVLSPNECQAMENALPRCLSLIERCYDSESVWSCVPASIYCNNAMIGPYQRTGQNVYDIRKPCENGNLCYNEIDWISQYLNDKTVMKALGAEVSKYDSCNFDINRNFLLQGDWMKPFHRLIPDIVKQIPVLIYAGDADYICNWLGNKAWTEALQWPGKKSYNAAEYKDLISSIDGSNIGSVKSANNLTFIRLSEGGHMVPHDQPAASLDMLNRFIYGEFNEQ